MFTPYLCYTCELCIQCYYIFLTTILKNWTEKNLEQNSIGVIIIIFSVLLMNKN